MNPLFVKYTPDSLGRFAGHRTYGYRSFEAFCEAVTEIRSEKATADDYNDELATGTATLAVRH